MPRYTLDSRSHALGVRACGEMEVAYSSQASCQASVCTVSLLAIAFVLNRVHSARMRQREKVKRALFVRSIHQRIRRRIPRSGTTKERDVLFRESKA